MNSRIVYRGVLRDSFKFLLGGYGNINCIAVCFLLFCGFLVGQASYAQPLDRSYHKVGITIDTEAKATKIPPGVIGWGAMWKRKMLWPPPPQKFTDDSHSKYIRRLGEANLPLIKQADVRNISWPWGVSFSTYAVNWENSIQPWTKRKIDCVRVFRRTAPWCEKTIVGVGDLLTLAQIWNLEAVTVSVPLAKIDGKRTRWGPGLFNHSFSPAVIAKVSDDARNLVDFMKQHPYWNSLDRVFLAAGCEWRHYGFRNPSLAVLTYAKLVKSIREKIPEKKVIVIGCASDGTDIPGVKNKQATSWNKYMYRDLVNVSGVALDLHRYRGMIGATRTKSNSMPLTSKNISLLMKTGLGQRNFLQVKPSHWGETGKPMPSVLLENAIHGHNADHSKHSKKARPWSVTMAHADLVREALRSGTLTFLGWTWFPESLPIEWPHGAMDENGKLQPHAVAQAFLSHYHRGELLNSKLSDENTIRANVCRAKDGIIYLYGGNFSNLPNYLSIKFLKLKPFGGSVEYLGKNGLTESVWTSNAFVKVPPQTLFRMKFQKEHKI